MMRPTRSARRFLALSMLTGYAAILVVAAWPEALRPRGFDGATRAANALLTRIRMSPGQPVFLGVTPGEWKIRAWCPAVIGKLPDGSLEVLYRPTDQCFWRGVRWAPDRLYVAFQSLLVYSGRAWTNVGDERRNAIYGLISDYFCNHRRGDAPLPDTVAIAEHRIFRSLLSGETRSELLQTYAWSCSARALAPRPWPVIPNNLALGPAVDP